MVGNKELAARYGCGAETYDELYYQEQLEKYEVGLVFLPPTAVFLKWAAARPSARSTLSLRGRLTMLSKALSIISALCPDGCTTIPANAESLPFRDAQFDVAYSFHVANLLERPAATSY